MSQTIKFNATGIAPTAEEISALERTIGHKLPQDFINLYADISIEFPLLNEIKFLSGPEEWGCIASVVSFSHLGNKYAFFCERYGFTKYLPFASDASGNFIVVAIDDGDNDYASVYFLDHETDECSFIAPSVAGFIEAIELFDISDLDSEQRGVIDVVITQDGQALLDKMKNKTSS